MSRHGVWAGLCLAAVTLAAVAVEAQPNWTKLNPVTKPTPRFMHAMAYDPIGRGVLLFGGRQGNTTYNDTWLWNGTNWVRKTPTTSPSWRSGHVMVADTARGRVVMFGGVNTSVLNETWEWDGNTWARKTPTASPSARTGHAMAYDPVRRRVVLFGGGNLNDTWAWDGSRWTRLNPTTSPPGRSGHGMAFDTVRRRVLLFGGAFNGPLQLRYNDTWEWDGVTWRQLKPAEQPDNSQSTAPMVSYAARKRVMIFPAGFDGKPWEWDGVTWIKRMPPAQPLWTYGEAMAYDQARLEVVRFGGNRTGPGGGYKADTWQYGFAVSLLTGGTPKRGNTVTLFLTARGQTGLTCQFGSSLGAGPIPIGGRSIGLSADALLGISTGGAWPAVFPGHRTVVDAFGFAQAPIHIPNLSVLTGVTIHSACVTVNPRYPFGIQSVTPTVLFRIQ